MLKIADNLSLTKDVATQKLAFLGRTGSGKTYAASKLAEEMIDVGIQVVILDCVGVWYGLRLDEDGKRPGISIPVFGGLHGDIPLEFTGGALVADLIVDRGISVVLDVSQFESDAQKARFGQEWADRFFFRKKAAPSAIHLFIEECQEFVPQNPMKGEERMLHAFQRIEKLGRNFGIGVSLISQRPQEINKKALNQTECLFAFQMTGPQERRAIEGWVSEKGVNEDIGDVLPRLRVGEAHVWSPQWLRISKTVRVDPKRTFNASSTPAVGKQATVRNLAPIDLDRIRTDMAATIEKARAEDPRELQKQVRDLKAQIAKIHVTASTPATKADPEAVKREFGRGANSVKVALAKEVHKLRAAAEKLVPTIIAAVARAEGVLATLNKEMADIALPSVPSLDAIIEQVKAEPARAPMSVAAGSARQHPSLSPRPVARAREVTESNGHLTGPEQRILDAISWLEGIGNDTPEQTAVSFLAGYTYGAGGYNNPRGALRGKGLIEYLPRDKIRLTDDGRKLALQPDVILNTRELHRRVLARLPGPEQRLLTAMLEAYPDALTNEKCAEKANYVPNTGGYNNPRGRLRSLGLIEYPQPGMVRARDILFLDGR